MPVLAFAMRRCRPEARAEAAAVERALLRRFDELLASESLGDLAGALLGHYPRTVLTVVRSENAEPLRFELDLWDDHDPASYPLEREAQNAALSLQMTLRA